MKTTVYRDSGFRSENLKWNDQMLCEVGIYLKGGSTAHTKCLKGTYRPKKEGTTAQQVLTSVSRPWDTARKGSCALLTSAGEHQPRVASSPAPVLSLPPDPGTAFLPGRPPRWTQLSGATRPGTQISSQHHLCPSSARSRPLQVLHPRPAEQMLPAGLPSRGHPTSWFLRAHAASPPPAAQRIFPLPPRAQPRQSY